MTRRLFVTVCGTLLAVPLDARPRSATPVLYPSLEAYYRIQHGVRDGELRMLARYGGEPKAITRRRA